MLTNNLRQNKTGLTIIELLVAIFIFSILLTIIMGIYVAFSNSQNRTQISQRLLNDAQYALESMAREVRNDKVYYDYVDCNTEINITNIEDCVILEKSDGTIVAFGTEPDGGGHIEVITYFVKNGSTWSHGGNVFDISQNDAVIDSVNFIISPTAPGVDPLTSDSANQNPLVTIELQISTNSNQSYEQVTYNLQTSVSPRVYRR